VLAQLVGQREDVSASVATPLEPQAFVDQSCDEPASLSLADGEAPLDVAVAELFAGIEHGAQARIGGRCFVHGSVVT
jgi:hypothetical protein